VPEKALAMLQQAIQHQDAKKALMFAEQITSQYPSYIDAYLLYYKVLSFLQHFSTLERIAKQAISHHPDHALSHQVLSQAYRFQRKAPQAISSLIKAVELSPENLEWQYNLAIMHKENGDFQQAKLAFEYCINKAPDYASAYWHLSDISAKLTPQNQTNLTSLLSKDSEVDSQKKVYAAYTLFKHFEAIQDYNQAFHFLTLGATLKRNYTEYNHQLELAEHQKIAHVFTQDFISSAIKANEKDYKSRSLTTSTHSDNSPIFICGLPRSGTTLTEQILSSHSQVVAGDELFELAQATQDILQSVKPNKAFPYWADELSPQDWRNIGERYIKLTKHINKSDYFTDKMPLNYKAIGLIRLALPEAKIIYCQRPPMDLLVGAYKQVFEQGHKYSYDLDQLASMIIAQHKLMMHWRAIFPENIFTLDYRALILDQKKTTQTLLQFLNLPWQDDCIDFHKNKRTVHTLSNTQVRKPLSNNSVDSWKNYSQQLKPYADKMVQAGLVI
jgi:tetratricopeptide (TPR) repeat protein